MKIPLDPSFACLRQGNDAKGDGLVLPLVKGGEEGFESYFLGD